MKIIRIDRSTIKKNPNAGNTQTVIEGSKEVLFSVESYDIPDIVRKEPFIITSFIEENGKLTNCSGVINGPLTPEQLSEWLTIKGFTVTIRNNTEVINHMPEPEYLYEYEDKEIKCKKCKNMINIDDIEHDEFEDTPVKICPICQHFDTFPEYRYEKISEVIKL